MDAVKNLLNVPDEAPVQENGMCKDTVEKRNTRRQAWIIWNRLGGKTTETPTPVESGIKEGGIKLAKLGKGYLRMARLGGHYSAARVRNVFARQIESKGTCDCLGFSINAYDEAVSRYYVQLRQNAMQ